VVLVIGFRPVFAFAEKRKTGAENLCENAAGMQTMTNGLSHGMNCFHRKISREQHYGIVA
jgi:hypothetical protein